jgi:TRAP-type C4-dicarboxylate transport system permease small subunit
MPSIPSTNHYQLGCFMDRIVNKGQAGLADQIVSKVQGLTKFVNVIAGICLTFMMLLTVTDVILRSFRMPVVGTYELVAFSGAIVIGFAVPLTTLLRGHVLVDFVVMKFPKGARNLFHIVTRCMGIFLFSLLGWNLFKVGMDLYRSGEVSLTLELPFYPVAFGLGVASFIQCIVLFVQILQVAGGKYE